MNIEDLDEIENVYIPMKDGIRLGARLFMPKNRPPEGLPAVLEYIPYRKRDLMRVRDEPIHRYFALQGFVSVRVDVRGTGDSFGILHDEYSSQEGNDAVTVIEWIAAQDWCSGKVGMMGISWGGFNSLQVAALQPPALTAIISLCAADDRYSDDAHYMGGCLLNENMQWGSILTQYASYPPDPEVMGDAWREEWAKRLEALRAFPAVWMEHPWRDSYWQHGSICEDYNAIKIPVYLIGGWADGYSNSILRTFSKLSAPKKALIGPWAHCFPHDGIPGPKIGFLQEATRWWEHWLKNKDQGVMQEPPIRIWMQESVEPEPQYEIRAGRWVGEHSWPAASIRPRSWFLGVGTLDTSVEESQQLSFSSPQTTGVRSGEWCGFGADGEMPRDQRPDDGGSLVFDGDPLVDGFEILGSPTLELAVRSNQPTAMIAVRLCDVSPLGSSLRVSYGLLNLTHFQSHSTPEALVPGQLYQITLKLNDIAHAFPAGHRIRLAISNAYWPIAWPSPTKTTLTVLTGQSKLSLPVRAAQAGDSQLSHFQPPIAAPSSRQTKLLHLPMQRKLEVDLATNELVYTLKSDGGELDGASHARIEDINLDISCSLMKRYRIMEDVPLSARTDMQQKTEFSRGEWKVAIELNTSLTSTSSHFQFTGDLIAYENGKIFKEANWVKSIPRKLV